MNFLFTILYILLFIFCLSVLVLVHEAGHLAAAKFFKVYCKEFSIGFGPAIFKKKRKNGETYFSLRAIPFGGYVSMYGEGAEEDPEFKDIDPSRSFSNIKKWKRIIILFAGVFNNAVLALLLFLISESCFEQQILYLSSINVDHAVTQVADIEDGSSIKLRQYIYEKDGKTVNSGYYVVDKDTAYVTYNDDSTKQVYAMIDTSDVNFSSRSYDDHLKYYLKGDGVAILGNEITANESIKSVSYTLTTTKGDFKQYRDNEWKKIPSEAIANPNVGDAYFNEENQILYKWDGSNWNKANYDSYSYNVPETTDTSYVWYDTESVLTPHVLTLNVEGESGARKFAKSGISLYLHKYWNNVSQVAKKTFVDWGDSATAIYRGLASLFTSTENWKDVGGIVAIGQQTTNILQNFGVAKFIYIWGLISVNLAIINLLPFPGLDGWQIVVLIVEAVAHREIPEKVKNIVSFVGLAILFAFMILILIKDVIGLF